MIPDGRTWLLELTSLFICFSDADFEEEEVDDPDEDELHEDVKEGDEDENAVVGGDTYNDDENALSSPGDKSSDPIIPFILMGRRIIRRFRRRSLSSVNMCCWSLLRQPRVDQWRRLSQNAMSKLRTKVLLGTTLTQTITLDILRYQEAFLTNLCQSCLIVVVVLIW